MSFIPSLDPIFSVLRRCKCTGLQVVHDDGPFNTILSITVALMYRSKAPHQCSGVKGSVVERRFTEAGADRSGCDEMTGM